jgi:hypothetical protein
MIIPVYDVVRSVAEAARGDPYNYERRDTNPETKHIPLRGARDPKTSRPGQRSDYEYRFGDEMVDHGSYSAAIPVAPDPSINYSSGPLLEPTPAPYESVEDKVVNGSNRVIGNYFTSARELYDDMYDSLYGYEDDVYWDDSKFRHNRGIDPINRAFIYGFVAPFKRIELGQWYRSPTTRPSYRGKDRSNGRSVPQIERYATTSSKKRWEKERKRKGKRWGRRTDGIYW